MINPNTQLTPAQIGDIKSLHFHIMRKLNEAIEGTVDFQPGPINNPDAPCLIRSAMYDIISLLNVINKAEGVRSES